MPIRHFESKHCCVCCPLDCSPLLNTSYLRQGLTLLSFVFVNVVFTGERRLIETVAVSQLKGTRLGVDGNYWLRKILVKEPSLTAMGGTPFTLQHAIEKELEHFKQVIFPL